MEQTTIQVGSVIEVNDYGRLIIISDGGITWKCIRPYGPRLPYDVWQRMVPLLIGKNNPNIRLSERPFMPGDVVRPRVMSPYTVVLCEETNHSTPREMFCLFRDGSRGFRPTEFMVHLLPTDPDPELSTVQIALDARLAGGNPPPTNQPSGTERTPTEIIQFAPSLTPNTKAAMLASPDAQVVAQFADHELWLKARKRVPNPPPTTVEGWAAMLCEHWPQLRTAAEPVRTTSYTPVQTRATPAARVDDDGPPLEITGSYTEYGTETYRAHRNVSWTVRVPARVVRQGADAVHDYVESHRYDDPDYGDTETGDHVDSDLDEEGHHEIDQDLDEAVDEWMAEHAPEEEEEEEEEAIAA